MQNALALSRDSGSLTFTRDTFLRWSFTLTLIAALLGTTVAQARSAPESFADLAERLLPAVVNISTTQTSSRTSSTRTVLKVARVRRSHSGPVLSLIRMDMLSPTIT